MPTPEPAAPREPIFTSSFLAACLSALGAFGNFYVLLATLPIYVVAVGGGERDVGLVVGVFSGTALVLRLFLGGVADRRGPKLLAVVGSAMMVGSGLLHLLARSPEALLGVRLLHGASWAVAGTGIFTGVADLVPARRRGEAMGYFGMFGNLAMAAGPALGVLVMKKLGFPWLFALSAVIGVFALAAASLVRLPPRRERPPAASGLSAFIEPTAVSPSLVLCGFSTTYGAIISFLALYAPRHGMENPGLFFTVYAATLILARGFTGALSDRRGRAFVIVPGFVLGAAGLALLAFAEGVPLFLGAAVLYGLAFAAVQPTLLALVVDRAPLPRRGVAMSMFSSAMDLGIGGGSMLWGVVAEHTSFETMFLVAAGLAVVSLGGFVLARPRAPAQAGG